MYFSTGPTSRSSSHSLVSFVSTSSSSSSSFTHFCVAVPVPVPSALFEVSPAVAAVEAVGYHSLPSLYTLPLPHDIVAVCLSPSLSLLFSLRLSSSLSLSLLIIPRVYRFVHSNKQTQRGGQSRGQMSLPCVCLCYATPDERARMLGWLEYTNSKHRLRKEIRRWYIN